MMNKLLFFGVWGNMRNKKWRDDKHLLVSLNRFTHELLKELVELVVAHASDADYECVLDMYIDKDHPPQLPPGFYKVVVSCASYYLSIDTTIERKRDDGEQFFVARQLVRQLRRIHERMDAARRLVAIEKERWGDKGIEKYGAWLGEWEKRRAEALKEDAEVFFAALSKTDADRKANWMVKLGYEMTRHGDEYTSSDLELLEHGLARSGVTKADCQVQVPAWFVPDCDIELTLSREFHSSDNFIPSIDVEARRRAVRRQKNTKAAWMGGFVVIKYVREPRSLLMWLRGVEQTQPDRPTFERKAEVWYRLNHPNVERLLGANHFGKLFFVCEESTQTLAKSIQTMAEWNKHSAKPRLVGAWQILLGIALGLEYLHDRGLSHGCLTCDEVVFRANHTLRPKISLLNWNSEPQAQDAIPSSIELDAQVPTRFRDDIVALGWCAAEVLTLRSRSKLRLDGSPVGMPAYEWQLLRRLCGTDSVASAMKITEVVVEFSRLAQEEKDGEEGDGDDCQHDTNRRQADSGASGDAQHFSRCTNVAEWVVPMAFKPIPAVIQDLQNNLQAGSAGVAITDADEIMARVADLYASMQARQPDLSAAVVRQFAFLLDSMRRKIVSSASSLSYEFSGSGVSVADDTIISFHRELDKILAQLQLSTIVDLHNWQRRRDERLAHAAPRVLLSTVRERASSTQTDSSKNGQTTSLVVELKKRKSSNSVGDLRGQQSAQANVSDSDRLLSVVPEWFISQHDVEYDPKPFSSGSFGTVHLGVWKGVEVVVKRVKLTHGKESEQRAMFFREVDVWFHLHHDNVIKLFGACHLGDPFFVCEYAKHGQIDKTRNTYRHPWFLLRDASLGLQYLHANGIVHADLKCNNILNFSDGDQRTTAKLADFGLSSVSGAGGPAEGAWRWKAPEVLKGGPATLASDVYSFGMCIIEAVSGEFPWGNDIPDAAVKHHVLEGKLPLRPVDKFTDLQWELVTRMCCFEPGDRLKIGSVLSVLEWGCLSHKWQF